MIEKRQRRWCFMDLVTDHKTGKMRETAFWSNIGKGCMTVAFCWVIAKGGSSEWLWVAYGGIVVLHEATARVLNQRDRKLDVEEEKKP